MYGRIEHRPSVSAPRLTPTAESGAYPEQKRHSRGVPRTDVFVERRRQLERLRAEPHVVHADEKCSHVRRRHTCASPCAHACAETHTHTHTHTRTHARKHAHTRTHKRTRTPAHIYSGTCLLTIPVFRSRCVFMAALRRTPTERVRAASRTDGRSGAYIGQVRHRRGVPRTDVHVERRRQLECLRAEPHAIHANAKCSHVRCGHTCARPCARGPKLPPNTRTNTHTHTQARTRAHTHSQTHTHPHLHIWTHLCGVCSHR